MNRIIDKIEKEYKSGETNIKLGKEEFLEYWDYLCYNRFKGYKKVCLKYKNAIVSQK